MTEPTPIETIAPERLHALARTIVAAGGSDPREAALVADHLVAANLAGHDSHGIGMLPDYVRCVRAGLLVPNQEPAVIRDRGAVLHLDGRHGYGQVMGRRAMELGIERARANGAVVVGLRNSNHLGRIGHWAEQCAAAGLVSLHMVNVADHAPLQAPWGCSDARLGTNPFCIGLPDGRGGTAFLLDMATSAIAFGKARVARNKGQPVPEGTLIDAEGRPTTDPTTYVDSRRGALLAFGRHKGSGLAVMCEMLGAALVGGMTIAPHHPRRDGIVNSMLSVLIDPAAFGEPDAIVREMSAIADWVTSSPPAPGFSEVLLPGWPEQRARAARAAGVPVDPKSLGDIVGAGESLGLRRAELLALIGRAG